MFMKHPTSPNSGFIVITDFYGDIVEHYPENSVIDVVLRRCEVLDKEFQDDIPHSAWRYERGGFSRILDKVHKDIPTVTFCAEIKNENQ